MKCISVVGARPQFIKLAPLCNAIDNWNQKAGREVISHGIIHTGQHYDTQMSDVFFESLSLPSPNYHLSVGSSSHAEQTAKMMIGIEQALIKERPDMLLLYGDTNSTLAGAIVASKLSIPIAHIEAGLRSYKKSTPEEINRLLTDHVSSLLFCSSQRGKDQLAKEGIHNGVHISGDIMYDVLKSIVSSPAFSALPLPVTLAPKSFIALTLHRAETTAAPETLLNVLKILDKFAERCPIVFPIHPRTASLLNQLQWQPQSSHFHLIEPLAYAHMLKLVTQAALVLTDSGGLQKEAYWLGAPCIILRDTTEWQELVDNGWNVIAGLNGPRLLEHLEHQLPIALKHTQNTKERTIYGNGNAAACIVKTLAS